MCGYCARIHTSKGYIQRGFLRLWKTATRCTWSKLIYNLLLYARGAAIIAERESINDRGDEMSVFRAFIAEVTSKVGCNFTFISTHIHTHRVMSSCLMSIATFTPHVITRSQGGLASFSTRTRAGIYIR